MAGTKAASLAIYNAGAIGDKPAYFLNVFVRGLFFAVAENAPVAYRLFFNYSSLLIFLKCHKFLLKRYVFAVFR